MTTAPAEDQRRLLEVQELDTRLAQLAHQRRTLPVLARITELESRAEDVGSSLVTSRTAANDLRRELTKSEADVEQVRVRAARDQSRLDAGQGSAKDMQAFTSELTALARRQAELEDVELEVMERLEAHQGVLTELESASAAIDEQLTEATAERDRELAAIDAEEIRVGAARASAVQGLDAALVALYEKLRAQYGGMGAAALQGRTCQGCRLELNGVDVAAIAKAPPEQVVRCEECGRILVRTPGPAKV